MFPLFYHTFLPPGLEYFPFFSLSLDLPVFADMATDDVSLRCAFAFPVIVKTFVQHCPNDLPSADLLHGFLLTVCFCIPIFLVVASGPLSSATPGPCWRRSWRCRHEQQRCSPCSIRLPFPYSLPGPQPAAYHVAPMISIDFQRMVSLK